MIKTGYRNILIRYINEAEPEQPILTEKIAKYVAEQTGLDKASVKKAVNVNMARLEKSGHIVRITKGIYCKRIKTAFGYYTPDRETLFCRQLLFDADNVIGYETGLSALNKMGLITQMPNHISIATNLYTKRIPSDVGIEVKKPSAYVNNMNYRYLQVLDIIRNLDYAPVDTARPAEVIRAAVREANLSIDMLILTARKHYSQKTLIRTIDILLGETHEAARR